MAPRDPRKVQLDFPDLVADLISELRLTGVVGLLDLLDAVRPVYIVASRAGALTVSAVLPTFTSAGISSGSLVNPAVDTVIADTGALAAGTYDIFASIVTLGITNPAGTVALQHRNAPNTITLANLLFSAFRGPTAGEKAEIFAQLPLTGYEIGLNERLRTINLAGSTAGTISAVIGVQIRPTP